ncbi:uncharacterized protein VTP21DRAFT_4089 [Calcarisporiella thermophila]|uniref:uncharacterized protein n=1 Tax=Calcarisporiella thermophila TaxID=911321 RepID=UPI0037446E30
MNDEHTPGGNHHVAWDGSSAGEATTAITNGTASNMPLTYAEIVSKNIPSNDHEDKGNGVVARDARSEVEQDDQEDCEEQYESNVVGVFVAKFDITKGNTIEWQYPADIDLEGVEFKAIPSAIHNVSKDVIYFSHPPYIGLCVFENRPFAEERGARMRSVGLLVVPTLESGKCGQVWRHLDFLKYEASEMIEMEQLNTDRLKAYLEAHQFRRTTPASPPMNTKARRGVSITSVRTHLDHRHRSLSQSSSGAQSLMSISERLSVMPHHPAHHFGKFVRAMGPFIFTIWKMALLRKKTLFYAPPPVEEACYYVYGSCLLVAQPSSSYSLPSPKEKLQPLFSISINDAEMLASIPHGLVACTTDKIYSTKPHLYDLYVSLPPPPVVGGVRKPEFVLSPTAKELNTTHIGRIDIRRYRMLRSMMSKWGDGESTGMAGPQDEGEESFGDTTRNMVVGGWWWWWYRREDGESRRNSSGETTSNKGVEEGEEEQRGLLSLVSGSGIAGPSGSTRGGVFEHELEEEPAEHGELEIELVRYFRHLTGQLLHKLQVLIETSEAANYLAEGGYDEESACVIIRPEQLLHLGLDPKHDRRFVEELAKVYFRRNVQVAAPPGCCSGMRRVCARLGQTSKRALSWIATRFAAPWRRLWRRLRGQTGAIEI